jgi:hypothetical protein
MNAPPQQSGGKKFRPRKPSSVRQRKEVCEKNSFHREAIHTSAEALLVFGPFDSCSVLKKKGFKKML